jgi:integrase
MPETRFLTLKQIDEQLDALADDVQMQAMASVLIYAGVRREELLWLAPDDQEEPRRARQFTATILSR